MSHTTITNPFGSMRVFHVPANYNVTGTCGKCGGPIIQSVFWSGTAENPEWCTDCGAVPKPACHPAWGPLRDMR